MKEFYYYMMLVLMALAAGCQREPINNLTEVYASMEDVEDDLTKTYLSGTDICWSAGDRIAVFYKNTLRKRFDVTPESIDSKEATFLLDESYVQTGNNENISNNVAYYPFCDVTCTPDGSFFTLSNLTIPYTQYYEQGSIGFETFPMVAVTEDTDDVDFSFKNICGVLQLQLTGYGFVKSVSVKGNNGEILAGEAVVTAGYGKVPSITMSSEGSKVVTLDCGAGVELDETTPTSFFIVLPPVQFEGGFTITVTDTGGGSKEYSTTKKNPVGRSASLKMPSKEYIGKNPILEGDYVDEYGINHGQGIEIEGVVWAPVNCGYHKDNFKYGKLYQWGRKYGQGYDTDKVAPTIQKGRVSLEVGQAEENSNCFYTNDSLPFDWLLSSRSDLWNGGTDKVPVKTEYDPCPKGWRVPTYTEFQTLIHLNHPKWTTDDSGLEGYLFTGKSACSEEVRQVFFIATGYRFGEKGTNSQPATHGTYWTSTPYPITYNCSTYYFYFNSMWAEVDMGGYSRSNGLTVRCVQE